MISEKYGHYFEKLLLFHMGGRAHYPFFLLSNRYRSNIMHLLKMASRNECAPGEAGIDDCAAWQLPPEGLAFFGGALIKCNFIHQVDHYFLILLKI